MGRYYHGDIEGKFWFAVQSSSDADYFGSEGYTPDELHYHFDTNNIPEIEEGIKNCETVLGEDRVALDKFFSNTDRYNDKQLSDLLGKDDKGVKDTLRWYARLNLGQKILNCVKEQGSCSFVAEL